MQNHDSVITRTIFLYYEERKRELKNLSRIYKKCVDMSLRRQIRERKQYLVNLLTRHKAMHKAGIMNTLNIPYKEVDKYPHLVEIKKKQQYLKHSLL